MDSYTAQTGSSDKAKDQLTNKQRERTQSQTHANNLGTNLPINRRQFIIIIGQFLVHKARVELIACTLEIIPEHETASLWLLFAK